MFLAWGVKNKKLNLPELKQPLLISDEIYTRIHDCYRAEFVTVMT
jgi:hypothetical protein